MKRPARRAVAVALLALAGLSAWRAATIPVTVTVDFGPLGRARSVRALRVWRGSSVVDALRGVQDVTQGVVCCDPKDVKSIGGFECDFKNKGWWLYEVNGAYGPVSAYKYILSDGDRVRWYYEYRNGTKKNQPAKAKAE